MDTRSLSYLSFSLYVTKSCEEACKIAAPIFSIGREAEECLNGIQSTKMEEVRNGMAKDVLFRSGLKGYKSDKKTQEQQDRRVTRSKR